MACIDFPTDEEQELLEQMRDEQQAHELKMSYKSLAERCQNEELLREIDLNQEEIAFEMHLIEVTQSEEFQDKTLFEQAKAIQDVLGNSIEVTDPISEVVYDSRVTLLADNAIHFSQSPEGQKYLSDLAETGTKFKEPGDWSSTLFQNEKDGDDVVLKELCANKSLGNFAENIVAGYLGSIRPGLEIIGAFENTQGQGMDLLTRDSKTGRLVSVEVKGQSSDSQPKAPHQMLKATSGYGKQGSEQWLRHHAMALAMQRTADVYTNAKGAEAVTPEMLHKELALVREMMTQEKGIECYVVGVRAENKDGDKPDGMSLRLSHRKAGQGNGYREVKDFQKSIPLDAVVPPKVEVAPDMSEYTYFKDAVSDDCRTDGKSTTLNSDDSHENY